jgi:uncharacterized coiled-coil protein SlyX
MNDDSGFDALFERLLRVTGVKTDSALARILNIKPQSVVAAKKRRQIPPGWIVTLSREYDVSADWLFFGDAAQAGPSRRGGAGQADGAGQAVTGQAVTDIPAEALGGEEKTRADREQRIRALEASNAALERRLAEQNERIRELERQLADAKDEALKAYRLAVEAMRPPVDTTQSRPDAAPSPPLYLTVDSVKKL